MKFVCCEGFGSGLAMRRFDARLIWAMWRSVEGIAEEGKLNLSKARPRRELRPIIRDMFTDASQALAR
jgi:hypothetical protein